jgi:enoyl-[acyl-carrier protein] reductase I
VNVGPLRSRAARAIGFIDGMVMYSKANAPLTKDLKASEIGQAALFLLSPAASAITGVTLYVDNGIHAMGLAVDSKSLLAINESGSSTQN